MFRRERKRYFRLHRQQRCDKDRKSTRLNSSHQIISYAVFCLKKKKLTILLSAKSAPSRAPPLANRQNRVLSPCHREHVRRLLSEIGGAEWHLQSAHDCVEDCH